MSASVFDWTANKISQCHDHNEVGGANAAAQEIINVLPTF